MKSRIVYTLFLIVFFISDCHGQAFAQEFTVYSGQLPPFNYRDESGSAKGIGIDVLREIMKEVGGNVDFGKVNFIDWPKAMQAVESTPNTILVSAGLTPDREFKFKWVGPLSGMNVGLIARRDSKIRIAGPADVKRYRIGVIKGSAPQSMLVAGYGINEKDLVAVDSNDEQLGMLKRGEVDMITHTDMSSPLMMKKHGLSPADYEMVHVLTRINLYYLINRNTDSRFVGKMQGALEAMKKSRFDVIVERYLGEGPLQMQLP